MEGDLPFVEFGVGCEVSETMLWSGTAMVQVSVRWSQGFC